MNPRNNRYLRILFYHWRNFQNKHSFTHGKGNRIVNHGVKVGSKIQITGNNNEVIIEANAALLNSIVHIGGNNCKVILKKHCYVTDAELYVENNGCRIEIGEETFVGRNTHIACSEDESKIIIGKDGMISSYCQVRTGDSHSVTDLEGVRLNPAASVMIGDHCWLGEGCKVLKGVTLRENTVVVLIPAGKPQRC